MKDIFVTTNEHRRRTARVSPAKYRFPMFVVCATHSHSTARNCKRNCRFSVCDSSLSLFTCGFSACCGLVDISFSMFHSTQGAPPNIAASPHNLTGLDDV